MSHSESIYRKVIAQLSTVFEYETGKDVLVMGIVRDLSVDENSCAHYGFQPPSPDYPGTVQLAMDVVNAVAGVEEVSDQDVRVSGYDQPAELEGFLRALMI